MTWYCRHSVDKGFYPYSFSSLSPFLLSPPRTLSTVLSTQEAAWYNKENQPGLGLNAGAVT